MTEVEKLKRGDVYRHVMSGGGGFGDPLAREPERVLRDVIEEKMTPAPRRERLRRGDRTGTRGAAHRRGHDGAVPRGAALRALVSRVPSAVTHLSSLAKDGVDGGAARCREQMITEVAIVTLHKSFGCSSRAAELMWGQ